MMIEGKYLHELPAGAVILLAYIKKEIDEAVLHANLAPDQKIENDFYRMLHEEALEGWIHLSMDEVSELLSISGPRQARFLTLLEKKKIVKIKRKGLPARRWVKLIDIPNGDKK